MGILDWLSRIEGRREPDADPSVQQAIELAVLGIDGRFCLVEDYAGRMAQAVEKALAHCGALAAIIPGPIDLLPDAWSRDPSVRALFARPVEIEQLLGRSDELIAFAAQSANAGAEEIRALLSMTRTERKVLGWTGQGEILHKDAVQHTVSFSDHRLLIPSASEADLRREIKWRAYEALVIETLAHLLRSAGDEPPEEWFSALLEERLQLLQRACAGLDAMHRPPLADEAALQALRQQLVDNGRQLASLHRSTSSLEEQLARVGEILAKPADIIAFSTVEDRLTSLNIVAYTDADTAAQLKLAEISIWGERMPARAAALVRLSPRQLKPRHTDYSAAEQWLGTGGTKP